MKYYEINETAARRARAMWSFSDYVEGSETASYRAAVDKCYEMVERLPDDLKERGERLADRYARRLAEWYNKKYRIEMMCPSVMISGSGNFPVRKKEKQNAASERHYQEYQEIQEIPIKIKNLLYGTHIIKAGDSDALEKLRAKLENAEALQAKMKETNAYYRKHKTMRGFGDLTDEKAAELDESFKRSMYGVPYPPYELSNNNAQIKNTRDRIARLERLKNAAESTETVECADLFKVVQNAEIMRLQLFFDGKPEENVRAILKKNGFKWSPSNGAWQRQLTENAKASVNSIISEILHNKDN